MTRIHRKPILVFCYKCRKPFKRAPSLIKGRRVFCDKKCYGTSFSEIKDGKKTCSLCKKEKEISNFSAQKNRYSDKRSCCKECVSIRSKKRFLIKKQDVEYIREMRKRHREWSKVQWNDPNSSLRIKYDEKRAFERREAIEGYGRVCKCCGESDSRFMTLDHVNDDGKEHRKELRSKSPYLWAIENGFPDRLQLLCWNCNMGKKIYGTCPHKKEKQ